MITKQKWAELVKEWSVVGECYQIPRRSKDRLKHFCEVCLPHLEGKKVLELGCNAGLFGYCIAEVAEAYCGVEPGNKIKKKGKKPKTDYFAQALITERHMLEFNPQVVFFNETIKEFCKRDVEGTFNAFVACFALYHFTDKELNLLKEHVWPKCDVVIIQNRTQKRPTRHNSYKFWKDKNIVEFFYNQGFCNIEQVPAKGVDGKQEFSEIICLK